MEIKLINCFSCVILTINFHRLKILSVYLFNVEYIFLKQFVKLLLVKYTYLLNYLLATGKPEDDSIGSVFKQISESYKLRSFFRNWSVFSHIRTEYREILHISLYSVGSGKIRTRKLRIRTLFTQLQSLQWKLERTLIGEVTKVLSVAFEETLSKTELKNLLTKFSLPKNCKFARVKLFCVSFNAEWSYKSPRNAKNCVKNDWLFQKLLWKEMGTTNMRGWRPFKPFKMVSIRHFMQHKVWFQ